MDKTGSVQSEALPDSARSAADRDPTALAGDRAEGAGGTAEAAAQDADYLANPAPDYPLASRLLGEEGNVTVRALVDTSGLPREVVLGVTCGHERLDKAALATVRRWTFRPASLGGKSRSGWVLIPIRFSLRRS
jgi:protein TonB